MLLYISSRELKLMIMSYFTFLLLEKFRYENKLILEATKSLLDLAVTMKIIWQIF